MKSFNICLCVHRGGRYDLILHLKYDNTIQEITQVYLVTRVQFLPTPIIQLMNCEGCQWIFLLLTILLIFIHLSMSLFG